jgi:DNA-binding winged helix-turn-helix (wHTH) protein
VTSGSFFFDRFTLDPQDRQLRRGDAPVELNSRYLDALALLVREHGKLVSKDRFLEEVWQGAPVTDEALTQCIKTLRRQLGDDAARPRCIETVPKHGYRFIAPVTWVEAGGPTALHAASPPARRRILLVGAAGTIGGGVAGLFGGLFYGAFAMSPSPEPGMGAASMLLVLVCITVLIGVLGGAGVALGIAAAGGRGPLWHVAGGGLGGLVIGSVVKLIGLDAFNLLFGQGPGDITGGGEGALLGAAVGLGAWLAGRLSFGRGVAVAGLIGALAGVVIALLGGRLMAGSLDLLAHGFANSRLRLDQIGALFGETGFGRISATVAAGLEGALFGACVAGAIVLARRRLSEIG